MDPSAAWVIPLSDVSDSDAEVTGAKTANLAVLRRAGLPVFDGFCIPTLAYRYFVETHRLGDQIAYELERKPAAQMRWEEMWDSALRIRNAFLAATVPEELSESILRAYARLGDNPAVAVRSSAPREDGLRNSFAGIHESVIDVRGESELLDAVKRVWSSLWSDAAILYAADLELSPRTSAMAVLIQPFVRKSPSGVAFGRVPNSSDRDKLMVEAVPAECAELVDGVTDPDRWVLRRSTGETIDHTRGARDDETSQAPLLDVRDLAELRQRLEEIEELLGWPPDVEWTGRSDSLAILQARPITTGVVVDKRSEYLRLRPSRRQLTQLHDRIFEELVPKLTREASDLAAETVETLADSELAAALKRREKIVDYWRSRYNEELIPLAHAVRQFGAFYNDAVKPPDPFEFVDLMRGQPLIASERDATIARLASTLRDAPDVLSRVERLIQSDSESTTGDDGWTVLTRRAASNDDLTGFLQEARNGAQQVMNVAFDGKRLAERPREFLHTICQLSRAQTRLAEDLHIDRKQVAIDRERYFLSCLADDRKTEGAELLEQARFAWKLRDDDNIYLARVESELLRAVETAAERLRKAGRIGAVEVREEDASILAEALSSEGDEQLALGRLSRWKAEDRLADPELRPEQLPGRQETVRQLTGQPAAPGLATGTVARILHAEDVTKFRAGNVLVCDAIQPMMTHLVPLASAIVERRGGMLIHGAIIARELDIPCVNGVPGAAELLRDGQEITVDGYLGIVTVGPARL
jgi:pyruvate,water dikinase